MRVNDRRNHHNVISVQCSECQSGEKTGAGKRQEPNVSTSVDFAVWLECTMDRVSDGDRSTLLSFVSRGASQGYAPQSGEIIGILTVLFRYVGIGTRLALTSSSSWCLTRSPLRQGWASFWDICQHTSSRTLFAERWPVSALPPAKRRARLNTCRSRPVSARCTRCRCYNVFALVLLSHHKSIGGRLLLLPQAARDGLALCHLSRQDTSRGVPSQGMHWSKVCVRVEGSKSLA